MKDIYGEAKKFVAHPIKYLNDSIAGTVEGAYNLVSHPVQSFTAIKDSVKDSFEKDVINGDAYSRSYFGTKTVLTIAKEFVGRKGTGLLDNVPNSPNRIITNTTHPNLSKDPKKPEETKGTGNSGPNFSPNFDKKLKKHAQDIYETSRDLGVPVKKGDKEGMKEFVSSIVNDSKNLANSKPFQWNTVDSVDAFVKGDAVVLVNRNTNEILTFLNKKGDRLSSKLKSDLDLIRE